MDFGNGSKIFSASEVAEAMTDMAKAGWTTTQIIEGMAGTWRLF